MSSKNEITIIDVKEILKAALHNMDYMNFGLARQKMEKLYHDIAYEEVAKEWDEIDKNKPDF